MESLTLEQKVMKFLDDGGSSRSIYGSGNGYGDVYGDGFGDGSSLGYGDDYGDGSGYGYGYDSDFGDGSGYGSGYGSSYGDGEGSGDGYSSGIKDVNGQKVYQIDNISTLIDVCHDSYAMGRILHSDLTTEKCFIVKQNRMFAYGKTLREARDALLEKLFDGMSEEERVEKFVESHNLNEVYQNQDFFIWHHRLTGSCLQGRTAFAQDHEINLDRSMTTKEFLELTKNIYGGDIIRRTIKAYES